MARLIGRSKKNDLNRRPGKLRPRVREIIVVYDGKLTEYTYFNGWRLMLGPSTGIIIRPLHKNSGGNVRKAVEAAVNVKSRETNLRAIYCVCDVDDTSSSDLKEARRLAKTHNIHLITSCRSIEVWLAMHWDKIPFSSIESEKHAIDLVRRHYPTYTRKTKIVPFKILYPRTEQACRNASLLRKQKLCNPATDVDNLVRIFLRATRK